MGEPEDYEKSLGGFMGREDARRELMSKDARIATLEEDLAAEVADNVSLREKHVTQSAADRIEELEEESRNTAKLYYDAMEQLNCRDTDVDERDAKIKALEEAHQKIVDRAQSGYGVGHLRGIAERALAGKGDDRG